MSDDFDILSYQRRKPRIHILTLDRVLSDDIYERLKDNKKTRFYEAVVAKQVQCRQRLDEIESIVEQTTSSRLLIMDVRKLTLPYLQSAYNKIIGYNRRDLNKLLFTILIGDGPVTLFLEGKSPDAFVPHLARHRVDYNPAVFFFDPFMHYQPDETEASMDEFLELPTQLPRRFTHFFPEPGVTVEYVRRFFRAYEQPEKVKGERLKVLAALYMKRIGEQFPEHKTRLKELLTKIGLQIASEKLNLYPIYFEQWVDDLMQKAAKPQTTGETSP
jgi:hypothetical protein